MSKLIDPSLWASVKPFGAGEQRPNNYLEIWDAIWENRDQLKYAWRILRYGCCDGCSLGTTGMRDCTMDEIHVCNVRLRLLRLNTMPALDHAILRDVRPLRRRRGAQLRGLGRLAYPMARRAGEPGFRRISWDQALNLVAERIRATTPDRIAFYLTSLGEPNENYYVAEKAARALGTNSVDNAACICHSPSTAGLKRAVGAAATTCSYRDWIGSDLVVFLGSNVAANQPVAMKYLYHAKKAGTKVAVVNSYREPGMERYWVPSNAESALFGTKIADRFFLVSVGGDVAFLNGTLKHMIEQDLPDRPFIGEYSAGFEEVEQALAGQSWDELERLSGTTKADMQAFARMVGGAGTAVFVAATRRGRQFNSMIQGSRDAPTGAARDAVLVSAGDAARLGPASGDPVRVANNLGALPGRALVAPVRPGTLQLHWPEAAVLIDRAGGPRQGFPTTTRWFASSGPRSLLASSPGGPAGRS